MKKKVNLLLLWLLQLCPWWLEEEDLQLLLNVLSSKYHTEDDIP